MMTKAIMIRAHQIARTCTGDYAARLAIGLRQAWMESRLARVGNEWYKNGVHRIYFNRLTALYGMDRTRGYISNSEGRRIAERLAGARVWYDMLTGQFHGHQIARDDLYHIVQGLVAIGKLTESETLRHTA